MAHILSDLAHDKWTALRQILFYDSYRDASVLITNRTTIDEFVNKSDNTYLVSFPRTGSHWLRMLMELYFGRPSLVRVFYYPRRRDYLTLHTHDLPLSLERSHVIYLYRDPVDTIYSQLRYNKQSIDDREMMTYWTTLYGRHLDKWLHKESYSEKKAILSYGRMKIDMAEEFSKICAHFGVVLDQKRLELATSQVTKEQVKRKTPHDNQVIDPAREYSEGRQDFRFRYGEFVWHLLLDGREHLRSVF